ncbi:MAG: ornithine carbamoyltransferase [Planctomycetota bacterium]
MHFISVLDHSTETLTRLLNRAAALKARRRAGIHDRLLLGRTLGMFFDKPSTRTRVSLEVAAASMGGYAIHQEGSASRLGAREPVQDVARVMSRYTDLIAIRTFGHDVVETFARYATVPVVNALSDYSHPTQAMADMLTLRERWGKLEGKKLVFVGDANNVARSLAAASGRLGLSFAIARPPEYGFEAAFLACLAKACPGMDFAETSDPAAAVGDADVLYTDVWTSMGQEAEAAERKKTFLPYQLNAALLGRAPKGCLVMHCLPAHRGQEITDEVLESPRSVVFDQAENRMHFYRGLFAELLEL